ncbi:hypothetical protein RND71_044199 [Anisodus tanguticus]|uniref:Uncharacterized protein n=1 Tax=Anisodus tanguticus TaxID=243964 RepID=A0AAE1QNI1_9SOLA|nr:hypothetical protein RND71_044199 [Anisodus tanguticus]
MEYDCNSGGNKFTKALENYFIAYYNLNLDKVSKLRLMAECEKIKEKLSDSNDTQSFKIENICESGSCKIPIIHQKAENVFGINPTLNKNKEVVALGCTLRTLFYEPSPVIKSIFDFEDYQPYQINALYYQENASLSEKYPANALILRGSLIPSAQQFFDVLMKLAEKNKDNIKILETALNIISNSNEEGFIAEKQDWIDERLNEPQNEEYEEDPSYSYSVCQQKLDDFNHLLTDYKFFSHIDTWQILSTRIKAYLLSGSGNNRPPSIGCTKF